MNSTSLAPYCGNIEFDTSMFFTTGQCLHIAVILTLTFFVPKQSLHVINVWLQSNVSISVSAVSAEFAKASLSSSPDQTGQGEVGDDGARSE